MCRPLFPVYSPATMERWPDVGFRLVQRLRRRGDINPASGERLVIAGSAIDQDMGSRLMLTWGVLELLLDSMY